MRFEVTYTVGENLRTDIIEAKDLDEAEVKANKKHPSWQDIRMVRHEKTTDTHN